MVEYHNDEPSLSAPYKTDLEFKRPLGFSSGAAMVISTVKTLFHLRSHIPCPYTLLEGTTPGASFVADSERLFDDIQRIFSWLEKVCQLSSFSSYQLTVELSFGISALNPAEIFHLHLSLSHSSSPVSQLSKIQRSCIRDLVSSSSSWPQAPSFPRAFFALNLPTALLRAAADLDLPHDSLNLSSELYCLPNYSSPISALTSMSEPANRFITSNVKPLQSELPDISQLKISNSVGPHDNIDSTGHWWFLASSLPRLVCF